MKILVINCGSSSLKYQLIEMDDEICLAQGIVERIGLDGTKLVHKIKDCEKIIVSVEIKNHKVAVEMVLNILSDESCSIIKDISEIAAVGHRVVHGGEFYTSSAVIDDELIDKLKECSKLAPLHNPPNIEGINICRELMPNVPMVAVFDTAFHHTIPECAYIYPIPYNLYEKNKIRKYGFHGNSHKYVSQVAEKMMIKNVDHLKIITCHLGNGSSVAAIRDGISIDTSMGFTPLAGLAMGTRAGNIDPSIITYLMEELHMDSKNITDLLNQQSGVLGISGISSDFRDLIDVISINKRAKLAIEVFAYEVKNFICSYIGVLGGVDCIVFTAGIGENSPLIRSACCNGLEFLGITIDKEKNNTVGQIAEISATNSKVKVFVIPTNEELVIARETMQLVM